MFKKIFSLFAALTLSVGLWAEGSVFTYTAKEKLPDAASKFEPGLHINVFYAADSTQLTITEHSFNEGTGTITFDGELAIIGDYAFYVSISLQSITIPASVTTIGKGAFGYCSSLASVTFEGNACQDAIGEMAFYEVGETTPATLVLPDNWTGSKPVDNQTPWYDGYFNYEAPAPVVGDQFVDATSGLKFEVTAVGETNTVKVITNNYTGTTYTIPATVTKSDVTFNVTEIGDYAFHDCSALQSITIPAGVTTIGLQAFSLTGLTSVIIPAGVTTIGNLAFFMTDLTSVIIPAGVTTIGISAFEMCSALQSIDIPASVTTIGSSAFYNCSSLASVTFEGNACQDAIGERAFYEVGKTTPATLVLPANWTGSKPDEEGNWYGGKFKLNDTALPTLFGANGDATKFLYNGQVIIRKDGKTYNALGQEVK